MSAYFVEQFVTGMFGRGMLTAEVINVVTEQNFTASATEEATVVSLSDTSNFQAGSCCVIKYASGAYYPHFITAKTASTLGIRPGLREAITTADSIERLWYNRAHPGKYYIRYLAQRVANLRANEGRLPSKSRLFFSQFDSNPTNANDTLAPYGAAVVNYYDETNLSQGVVYAVGERNIGRTAYITINANGDGADTAFFPVGANVDLMLRSVLMVNSATAIVSVSAIDNLGRIYPLRNIETGTIRRAHRYIEIPFRVLRDASEIQIRITSNAVGLDVIVDQLEVFPLSMDRNLLIGETGKIVAFGDSWVAGDVANTLEREPLTTQLAIELPNATILNEGVGGNTIYDLLSRFEADVVPHSPDVVVINVGTNDCYSPSSSVFYPNAVNNFNRAYCELIGKIYAIGARPIIIGVPALAETDAGTPSLGAWELNDRAKTYSRYFYKTI